MGARGVPPREYNPNATGPAARRGAACRGRGARLRVVNTTDQPRRRFSTPVRVRYADTDATGTLQPTAYLVYFEVARVEALRGLGVPVGEFVSRGVAMPVIEAGINVVRPARIDDLLEVGVFLDRIGPASFSFDYEVTRDGLLLADGYTRMAVIEPETGRALRLPDWVRELLVAIAD
jgi:acyl-CoA thioester hydrolase